MGYENHPVYRRINREIKRLPAILPASPSINISVNDAEGVLNMIKELYELREQTKKR